MYNYDFKENNEQIILEKRDSYVDIENNSYQLSIIITNKNILLFSNINKNNPLNSRGVILPGDYLLNLSIPLKDLNYKIEGQNTIISYNNHEIVLYDILINKYL